MSAMAGRCLCGGIRFEAEPPSLFVAHCHCRYCREAHGAAFVTWVGVADDRFRVIAGSDLLRWYESSTQSRRGFCARCGTTLFFASALCPGEIHVTRASFTTAVDREPQLHCFYDQRAGWATAGDDLPRYSSDHEGLSKYQVIPP